MDFPGKTANALEGDAESDAVCVVSDSRLARLNEVWPTLSDDVKGEIARLAGLRPDDLNDIDDLTPAMAHDEVTML